MKVSFEGVESDDKIEDLILEVARKIVKNNLTP